MLRGTMSKILYKNVYTIDELKMWGLNTQLQSFEWYCLNDIPATLFLIFRCVKEWAITNEINQNLKIQTVLSKRYQQL